jgi:hypothetical protein
MAAPRSTGEHPVARTDLVDPIPDLDDGPRRHVTEGADRRPRSPDIVRAELGREQLSFLGPGADAADDRPDEDLPGADGGRLDVGDLQAT